MRTPKGQTGSRWVVSKQGLKMEERSEEPSLASRRVARIRFGSGSPGREGSLGRVGQWEGEPRKEARKTGRK